MSLPSRDTSTSNIQKEEEEISPSSFHPDKIHITTFHTLLGHYPSTVRQVQRRKLVANLRSKGKTKKASQKKEKKATTDGTSDAEVEQGPSPLTKDEENRLNADLETFLKLDEWRYTILPKVIGERGDNNINNNNKQRYIHKEELVQLMQWKLYAPYLTISYLFTVDSAD